MHALKHESLSTPPLASIFILSAAALAYEVLLIRLFSIIHWHHFAFMVISIALLGYGASGSLITVFRNRLIKHYELVFQLNILLFGLFSIGCFIAVQWMPFNALEIIWDSSQWQQLLYSYVLLTLPFFFVANAIALSMMYFNQHIPLLYGVDLIGAGVGALAVMLLLQLFPADTLLRILAGAGFVAGLLALYNLQNLNKKIMSALMVLSAIAVILIPQDWLELRLSEYKGLPQTLLMKDTSLLLTHSSPLARLDVVESPFIPFRHAPGLSLKSPSGPPRQLAVFSDGDAMTVIDQVTHENSLEYTRFMSSALPYHMRPAAKKVLVLQAATGSAIQQASYHGASDIHAVAPDRKLTQFFTQHYAHYSGWQNIRDKVTIHNQTARGFSAVDHAFDLVIMGPSAASSGGAAGVHALSTSYEFTTEAIHSYLQQLAPNGLLSLTLWTSNPPRANLKLFATAVRALRMNGISQPQNQLAWIRSWNTATLMIKNSELTSDEIKRVREFSRERNFDLAWLPDISAQEVNRYQKLQRPFYYLSAKSLLQNQASNILDNYQYDIQPATDNSPYFNHFFKWSSLQQFLSLPARSGISMIGVGYPTLLVTLAQALLAAFVLILLPLFFLSSKKPEKKLMRWKIIVYFLCIGLAFLFIEIAFIQKYTLILSQPLYAVAVALCAFLIFSGVGSLYVQQRLLTASSLQIRRLLGYSVVIISITTLCYTLLFPELSQILMIMPEWVRIVSTFILAAPLAFAMGMPFPIGLATLQMHEAQFIPWAWGINGCASVLSAILAVILAMEIGFNGIMLCALILYILAWRSGLTNAE